MNHVVNHIIHLLEWMLLHVCMILNDTECNMCRFGEDAGGDLWRQQHPGCHSLPQECRGQGFHEWRPDRNPRGWTGPVSHPGCSPQNTRELTGGSQDWKCCVRNRKWTLQYLILAKTICIKRRPLNKKTLLAIMLYHYWKRGSWGLFSCFVLYKILLLCW